MGTLGDIWYTHTCSFIVVGGAARRNLINLSPNSLSAPFLCDRSKYFTSTRGPSLGKGGAPSTLKWTRSPSCSVGDLHHYSSNINMADYLLFQTLVDNVSLVQYLFGKVLKVVKFNSRKLYSYTSSPAGLTIAALKRPHRASQDGFMASEMVRWGLKIPAADKIYMHIQPRLPKKSCPAVKR